METGVGGNALCLLCKHVDFYPDVLFIKDGSGKMCDVVGEVTRASCGTTLIPVDLWACPGLAEGDRPWNLQDAASFVTGILGPTWADVALEGGRCLAGTPGGEVSSTLRKRAKNFSSTKSLS